MKRARWHSPEVMNAPVLVAVAILALNDHLLKGAGVIPPVVTGKLSDLAGLFYFPFLLAALVRLALRAGGARVTARASLVGFAAVATGVVFAAVKCTPAGATAYRHLAGALTGHPAALVADPTDLAALVVLPLGWLYARRHLAPSRALASP